MTSSSQSQPPRRSPLAATLGWGFVWLAGTSGVAAYSVTQHAPALEDVMLNSVQDAIAPISDSPITVSVSDHAATLSGSVADDKARDAVLAAAGGSLGIRQVVDQLALTGGRTADDDNLIDLMVDARAQQATEPDADLAATQATSQVATQATTQAVTQEATQAATQTVTDAASGNPTTLIVPDGLSAEPDMPAETLAATGIATEAVAADGTLTDTPATSLPEAASELAATDLTDDIPSEVEFDADEPGSGDLETDALDALSAAALPSEDLLPPDPAEPLNVAAATTAAVEQADALPSVGHVMTAKVDAAATQLVPIVDATGDALDEVIGQSDTESPSGDVVAQDTETEDAATEKETGTDGEAPLVAPTLRLELVERELTIEGTMADADDAAALVLDALDDIELDYVSNSLESDDGVASADWLETVANLLATMNELEQPAIHVDNDEVKLLGTAPTNEVREAIVSEARERLGEQTMVSQIKVVRTTATINRSDDDVETTTQTQVTSVESTPTADASSLESSVESADADESAATAEATTDAPPATSDENPVDVALLDAAPNTAEGDASAAETTVSPTTALRTAFAMHAHDRILFETDSATLTAESRLAVNGIADLLREHPGVPLAIEGHTDGVGLREDNLKLSQLRANAVRDQLIARGIARARITTYGYGEGVPVADNSTPEGRAANRRIEFTF